MSGYIQAGYVIALATLFVYGVTLLRRERRMRRRLERLQVDIQLKSHLAPARTQSDESIGQ